MSLIPFWGTLLFRINTLTSWFTPSSHKILRKVWKWYVRIPTFEFSICNLKMVFQHCDLWVTSHVCLLIVHSIIIFKVYGECYHVSTLNRLISVRRRLVLEPIVTQNTKCHLKVQLVLEFPLTLFCIVKVEFH